jgi:hypothetical protein
MQEVGILAVLIARSTGVKLRSEMAWENREAPEQG